MFNYNDAYIILSGTIAITGAGADDAVKRLHERDKGVILRYLLTA